MSESLFAGLCQIVGTSSQQFAIRRGALNITEVMTRQSATDDENSVMLSGSRIKED